MFWLGYQHSVLLFAIQLVICLDKLQYPSIYINQHKYTCTYSFPWLAWYDMWHQTFFWLCGLKFKKHWAFLIAFSMSLLILTQFTDSMAMLLMSSSSRAHLCREAGIIILLCFITIPSITAVSSQNGKYGLDFCLDFSSDERPSIYHICGQCI